MKKLRFLLVVGFVLFLALFLGCDYLIPPDVRENAPDENAASTDAERPL
jgi:hypothetical protein